MKKQEYLNIVKNEINKNQNKLEETINLIEFYSNINDENKVKELEKNKLIYKKRIEKFSEIEKLPIYLQLKNCDSNDLKKYNEKNIFNLLNDLKLTSNKIKSKESMIEEFNKKINDLYELYKNTNDFKYENEARILLNNIKIYKEQIESLKNEESDLRILINGLKDTKEKDLLNKLMIKYGISVNDMENILEKNIVGNLDKLAVPICNNLDILNYIKEYEELNESIISLPFNIQDLCCDKYFTEEFLSTFNYIKEFLSNDNINIYNVKDFNMLDNKIRNDLKKLTPHGTLLELYSRILDLFPKNINDCNINNLKTLIFKVLIEGEDEYNNDLIDRSNALVDDLTKIEELQIKLNKRYFKTKGINEKIELLNYKRASLIQETLDILWKHILEDIFKIVDNVNHNIIFKRTLENNEISDISQKNLENKSIIETYRYSFLNLVNLKQLVTDAITKFNMATGELMKLSNVNNNNKDEFIKQNEEKETKLKELENKINSMYKKVSSLKLETDVYNDILNLFMDNNIIDSIVNLELEELINNVKKNSYKLNIIDDLFEGRIDFSNEKIVDKKENVSNIINEEKIEEKDNNNNNNNSILSNDVVKENYDSKKETKNTINQTQGEKKETNKKFKINKEELDKIKKYIIDLGIDYNTIKTLVKSVITNDELLDNILYTSDIEKTKKDNIKYVLKNINLDSYYNVTDLVVDLNTKYDLDLNTLKQLGKDILKNRSVIFNIIKSNKKVLFNVLKSDVLKKILKK